MTVREILEAVDREIENAKAQTIRLESVRARINACVKGEPTPALKPRRGRKGAAPCDEQVPTLQLRKAA